MADQIQSRGRGDTAVNLVTQVLRFWPIGMNGHRTDECSPRKHTFLINFRALLHLTFSEASSRSAWWEPTPGLRSHTDLLHSHPTLTYTVSLRGLPQL